MAQQLLQPLMRRLPSFQIPCYSSPATILCLHHFFDSSQKIYISRRFLPVSVPSGERGAHFKHRGLRLKKAPTPEEMQKRKKEEEEAEERKSRSEKKRLAQRAVRWGMDLAEMPDSQIKSVLTAVAAEPEVFEAVALVKRLGTDVKEGKRRQFNLIGKLLRDVNPELMDRLLQASKDGGLAYVLSSLRPASLNVEDDVESKQAEDSDEVNSVKVAHTDKASKWFDGLVNKDISITNEVYSISSIEFDRQELRKLVRNVQSVLERPELVDENIAGVDRKLMTAQKSLNRFLYSLAKRLPID